MLVKATEPSEPNRAFRALGNGVLLAEWPGALPEGDRIIPASGDAPIGRVQVAVAVPADDGATRTFVAFRLAAPLRPDRPLAVRNQDGDVLASLGAGERPAPIDRTILDGLSPLGRFRLVRFLLCLCARTFRLGGEPDYVEACRALVLAVAPEPALLGFRQRLTPGLCLYEGRIPAELGRVDQSVVIGPDGIAASPFAPQLRAAEPSHAGTAACDLVLESGDRLGESDLVVMPMRCAAPAPRRAATPNAPRWCARPRSARCSRPAASTIRASRSAPRSRSRSAKASTACSLPAGSAIRSGWSTRSRSSRGSAKPS
jgi:hypothetical protein